MINSEVPDRNILVAQRDICIREQTVSLMPALLRGLGLNVRFVSASSAREAIAEIGNGQLPAGSDVLNAVILDELGGKHTDVTRVAAGLHIPVLYHVGDKTLIERINSGEFAAGLEEEPTPGLRVEAYPNYGRTHLSALALATSRLFTPQVLQ